MKLHQLMDGIRPLSVAGTGDPEIKSIVYDSRQAKDGALFVALPGSQQDGNRFIQDAVDRGAAAIVTDRATALARPHLVSVQVDDPRRVMAELACAFYDRPADKLQVVGITGTNGKTTTAFMVRDVLAAADRPCGLIGTVEYRIGERVIPATRTTPESPDMQHLLAQMAQIGCRAAVMEVSSHALDQKRVWGIAFDVAVFTNLTHDHLDYHGTLERYFEAKWALFAGLRRGVKQPVAVINADDRWGRELLARRADMAAEVITYGYAEDAMVRPSSVAVAVGGSRVTVRSPWGEAELALQLQGRYNVSNALAAFAAAGALGVAPAVAVRALSALSAVPGRLEAIPTQRGFQVFVDYAHTEDALQNVLTTLRELAPRRLLVVFGCGGNRDKNKRPRMGAVVARLADYAVLTSDNPRKENPSAIIAQIRAGMPDPNQYEIVEDRHEAIVRALSLADQGDIVLIAGKGHENYQEFANTVLPFDDRQIVRECLAE